MNIVKKVVIWMASALFLLYGGMSFAQPVNFQNNFARHLIDWKPDAQGRVETVFDWGIDRDKTLIENVRMLFYPDATGQGWKIYDLMRPIIFAILLLFIILVWIFVIKDAGDGNKSRDNLKSLIYIGLWAFIFLVATWILGVALNIDGNLWSEWLIENASNNIIYQIFAFLKWAAFFVAVAMMIWYWYRVMSALDSEEKFSQWRQWVMNVLIALIFIKVIDFLYFIAQEQNFQSRATETIISFSKIMLWLLGAAFTIAIIYSGFMLITGRGKSESFDRLKNTVTAIFLWSIVLFMFLLILYQVIQEFGG